MLEIYFVTRSLVELFQKISVDEKKQLKIHTIKILACHLKKIDTFRKWVTKTKTIAFDRLENQEYQ